MPMARGRGPMRSEVTTNAKAPRVARLATTHRPFEPHLAHGDWLDHVPELASGALVGADDLADVEVEVGSAANPCRSEVCESTARVVMGDDGLFAMHDDRV